MPQHTSSNAPPPVDSGGDAAADAGERAAFDALKPALRQIWDQLEVDRTFEHTSVIVPSLSVNQTELAKVTGAAYYEERLLFALIRLMNPNARLIYITSQPVHPEIVEYYLGLLRGVSPFDARRRLHMLSVYDASPRALTQKILERPRFIRRLSRLVGDRGRAYLTCYNATALERRLAVALGLPLNGVDPELLPLGTKSGNREVFAAAGVNHPAGFENLHDEASIVRALMELARCRPGIRRAVVKLNDGFAGEGNALFSYPENAADQGAIGSALEALAFTSADETWGSFREKLAVNGGIVEEFIAAEHVRSPSVQLRIAPDGEPAIVSSHEQILGGATGQTYLGCQFPARDDYRLLIQQEAEKVGRELGRRGVIGRFAIDFMVLRDGDGAWTPSAIEINLRMGGTTPPLMALEFLTGGTLDRETGLFNAPGGQPKYYSATDNLKSPTYRGLLPEDLLEIVARRGLGFDGTTRCGVLFFMIGALSQFGKVGMTCICDTPGEAQALFERVTRILDEEAEGGGRGILAPLLDLHLGME